MQKRRLTVRCAAIGSLAAALPIPMAAQVPLGQFQVNTFTLGSQESPSVATDAAGNFVVVFDENNAPLKRRRYAADGTPLAPVLSVNTEVTGGRPDVAAAADGSHVVVWHGPEIY